MPNAEWLQKLLFQGRVAIADCALCLGAGGRIWLNAERFVAAVVLQMSRNMEPPYDIQERTFVFAVQVVNFCRELCDAHPVSRRLSWQLLDAATSTGANMEEASAGQSKPDFVSKTAIARKEARESIYWLRLLAATDARCRSAVPPLLDEAKQIAAIISAIKRKAESNPDRGV
jgi:four helix bundle protein